jgi:hypothetical protein
METVCVFDARESAYDNVVLSVGIECVGVRKAVLRSPAISDLLTREKRLSHFSSPSFVCRAVQKAEKRRS